MRIDIQNDYHLTQTERKYIKLAYDYCITNSMQACTVNSKTIQFDFTGKQGIIMSGKKVKCMDGKYRPEVFKRFTLEDDKECHIN